MATQVEPRPGKFKEADGGSLFLDEVADLSPGAQAKVLRALREGEVQRPGATKPVRVDVRVIAATHRDLKTLVKDGKFREDLYFRLCVIPIALPPLRDRREDIPLLIAHFMHASGQSKRLSRKTLKILMEYGWPGNVAELQHVIVQTVVLSQADLITEHDIPQDVRAVAEKPTGFGSPVTIAPGGLDLKAYLNGLEKTLYEKAIKLKGGNYAAAARLLRVEPHTFRKRAKNLFGQ